MVRQIIKQFLMVIVIFSFICPGNLWAKKEKPGVYLRIIKTDGSLVEGELLKVKPDTLVLMTSASKAGVFTALNEIDELQCKRQKKYYKGMGIGMLVLGSAGFASGLLFGKSWTDDEETSIGVAGSLALYSMIPGAILGFFGAAVTPDYKRITLKGKSQEEIKDILDKLDKRARFSTSTPGSAGYVFKDKKIHITVNFGYFKSPAFQDIREVFERTEIAAEEPLSIRERQIYTDESPAYYLKNGKIEFAIGKKFALGVLFSLPREFEIRSHLLHTDPEIRENPQLSVKYEGSAYYLTAAYIPIPVTGGNKLSFSLGAGLGLSPVKLNFRSEVYSQYVDDNRISKNPLSFIAFVESNYYFTEHVSVGLNVQYEYIPVRVDDFQLDVSFGTHSAGGYGTGYIEIYRTGVDFPGYKVNFGGFGIGINLGFHF